jgi:hypothetical protein
MHCTSRIPTQRRHFNALTRISALSALPSHTLFFRKWRYCRANNIFFSFRVLAQRLLSPIGTQPALWLLRCVGQRLSARLSPSHLSNPQAFPLFIPPHSTPRAVFSANVWPLIDSPTLLLTLKAVTVNLNCRLGIFRYRAQKSQGVFDELRGVWRASVGSWPVTM